VRPTPEPHPLVGYTIGAVVVDVVVLATGGDLDKQQAVDIMTSDLVTARPTDSIASVGRLMIEAGVRHIVIREDGTVVGLVSIRDVLAVLLGGDQD